MPGALDHAALAAAHQAQQQAAFQHAAMQQQQLQQPSRPSTPAPPVAPDIYVTATMLHQVQQQMQIQQQHMLQQMHTMHQSYLQDLNKLLSSFSSLGPHGPRPAPPPSAQPPPGASPQRPQPQARLPSSVKVPPPEPFAGTKDAEQINGWLFRLGQYFDLTGVEDPGLRIGIAGTLLRGPASTWYRALEHGPAPPADWEQFEDPLRAAFMPADMVLRACEKLAKLSQGKGPATQYVAAFRTLVLEIPDMAEPEKFYAFRSGLSPTFQFLLDQDGIRSYTEAVKKVERISSSAWWATDTGAPYSASAFSSGPTPMELNSMATAPRRSHAARLTKAAREQLMAEGRCFKCRKRGHTQYNCPNNAASNSDSESEEGASAEAN